MLLHLAITTTARLVVPLGHGAAGVLLGLVALEECVAAVLRGRVVVVVVLILKLAKHVLPDVHVTHHVLEHCTGDRIVFVKFLLDLLLKSWTEHLVVFLSSGHLSHLFLFTFDHIEQCLSMLQLFFIDNLLLDHFQNSSLQLQPELGLEELLGCHSLAVPLIGLLLLPQVLLHNALLLHALSALLLLSVLVPKAVEENVFDFATGVVLADDVQVLLGFVARDIFDVIYG